MPFRYSKVASDKLPIDAHSIEDLRNNPVKGRKTRFRLSQQNMLAYTFDSFVPGWGPPGINSMEFGEVVEQTIRNANDEGRNFYGIDYEVNSNAVAKVTGDIYEVLTTSVLWNAAAHWNRYMRGQPWVKSPRYARPSVAPDPSRQVAVLNLPRRYDWVRLLEPSATAKIESIRADLQKRDLSMPTSTPDVAIVILPGGLREDDFWSTPIDNLSRKNQAILNDAHVRLLNRVEAGEMILAIALKSSLRSDRLYQPLYEANIMQFLLEGHLDAPKVEFEVHTLDDTGTKAKETYRAASIHSAGTAEAHRAVRELYKPASATELVQRFMAFLNNRMALVAPGVASHTAAVTGDTPTVMASPPVDEAALFS